MNLRRACPRRESPVARLGVGGRTCRFALGSCVERKYTADAVILAAEKTEQVREGDLVPVKVKLGGLQARRRSRDVAAHQQRSRGLQRNAAAPGLRSELQPPAAGSNLLDAAGNSQERKR